MQDNINMFFLNNFNLMEFIGFWGLSMFHLFIFLIGAINLKDQIFPSVEENLVRTRKMFISSADKSYDHEHFSTFRPMLQCFINFLHPSKIDNFGILQLFQTCIF